MSREDDLVQNLDDIMGLVDQILAFITAQDAIRAGLETQVATLVAGDAATAAKVQAAFDKSEAAENKLRAALPFVPPVGGTPLLQSYTDRTTFDAAVAAYTGPEGVTVDGTSVKTGTSPTLDYFTQSDATISTTAVGPTGPT